MRAAGPSDFQFEIFQLPKPDEVVRRVSLIVSNAFKFLLGCGCRPTALIVGMLSFVGRHVADTGLLQDGERRGQFAGMEKRPVKQQNYFQLAS